MDFMKKAVLICTCALIALLFSCKKEDRYYNDDGSPITMEQALEIVRDKVDYYDWVEISTEVIKGGQYLYQQLQRHRRIFQGAV